MTSPDESNWWTRDPRAAYWKQHGAVIGEPGHWARSAVVGTQGKAVGIFAADPAVRFTFSPGDARKLAAALVAAADEVEKGK